MPAVFAHTRTSDFAQTYFDFVSDDGGENQILAAQTLAFTERQRRGDEIARMTRVGFPIDVVVIHGPDHVAIQKCGIHWVGLEPGNERGGFAPACGTAHRAIVFEQDLRILLLAPTQSAADGIEPK